MRFGSWLAIGDGTWTGPGASRASGVASEGPGEAGPSAAGSRLPLSVEILSTMLDRQSRLETTELRSLFTPPAGQNIREDHFHVLRREHALKRNEAA